MKKAIVYGLGERYHRFEKWVFEETQNDYQILAISDKNAQLQGNLQNRFVDVKEIADLDFDVIIVTSDRYFEEIFKELQDEYKIPAEKIMPMQEILESIYREKFLTHLFDGKQGVEIGGPSTVFESNIYMVCKRCDGVNYSADTVWWKNESDQYHYNNQVLGDVIIADAVDLSAIASEKYEFCISSNNLEHIANPIKALAEQKRIIKKDGLILAIVPMKDKCFDHNREFTDFDHLLHDYINDVSEDDLTHLDEIMDKHDFDMDPACGGKEKFAQRALKNYENRCLHQHVFHIKTLISMYQYLNLTILNVDRLNSNYFIIGRK